MVDISARIDTICNDYVREGKYFTINRANHYLVIRLSFEAADELFVSLYLLAMGLIRRISRILKAQGVERGILEEWNQPVSEVFPLDDLGERITLLCNSLDREIVLIIDEVDKS